MDYGSPNKNLNKGYKSESVKTEKSNLMNDNPVVKDASGGRSWMSKHSQSGGSPVKKHHGAPMKMDEMYNGKPGVQKEDFEQFKK